MQELLVLGLIPGTNIQITFTIWLAAAVAVLLAATYVHRARLIEAVRTAKPKTAKQTPQSQA